MNEITLIEKAKKGDRAAMEMLLESYAPKVFNLSCRLLCNNVDASDAAQDSLIKIYDNINKFHGSSRFSTWVYRLTYNTCIDFLRKKKKTEFYEINESMPDNTAPPHEIAEKNERIRIINRAISELPEDYRAVIVLRDVNGHSYEEISEILGCSLGTVKSRINRGRSKLKEILSLYMEQNITDKRQKE